MLKLWRVFNDDGYRRMTEKLFSSEKVAREYCPTDEWLKGVEEHYEVVYESMQDIEDEKREKALWKLTLDERKLLGL